MVERRHGCQNPQCLDREGNQYHFTTYEELSPGSAAELDQLRSTANQPPARPPAARIAPKGPTPAPAPASDTVGPASLSAAASQQLERIHQLWRELRQTEPDTNESEELTEKIRVLSEEYRALATTPTK